MSKDFLVCSTKERAFLNSHFYKNFSPKKQSAKALSYTILVDISQPKRPVIYASVNC